MISTSTTGDLKNNLLKVESEMKRLHYTLPLNVLGASRGDPAALLPLLHHILLDFSSVLATHFAAKGYELYGKKDVRFLEGVYQLLRREFTYRPQLTRQQFFSMGFAERKLILVNDIIQLCKQLDQNLSRQSSGNSTNRRNKPKEITEPPRDTMDVQRNYSPELALANFPSDRIPSPFPSKSDTFYHARLKKDSSSHESESILNHPPSRYFSNNQSHYGFTHPQFKSSVDGILLEKPVYPTAFKKSISNQPTTLYSPVVQPDFNQDSFLSPSSFMMMSPKMSRSPALFEFNKKSPDTTTFSGAELHSVLKMDVSVQTLPLFLPHPPIIQSSMNKESEINTEPSKKWLEKYKQLETQLQDQELKNKELQNQLITLQSSLDVPPTNHMQSSSVNLQELIQKAEQTIQETKDFVLKL